ncbi:MAG: trimethylamine methyltransferase family protein [Bacillota bacterium]|nr:trimethylamine methyltransferase family protein [Bacillota bacterium]
MSAAGVLTVLSDSEIREIHDAAVRVLAECGVFVDYRRALEHLAAKGADVDFSSGRVRFPPALVESALQACPPSFSLYDREGNVALEVGGDEVHFATGSCAIRYQEDGSARPSRAEDLVRLARVADTLPQIHLQSTAVVAGEAPKTLSDTYRLYLVLTNSSKPIITGAFSEQGLWDMKSLLDAVTLDRTPDAPCAVFDVCPSPPLKWTAISAANVMDGAAAGLPIEFVSMPMPGAASPATLAGSVVVHTAETLSGVVLAQTVRRGARLVWGGAPVQFDMRCGTTPLSAVEATLIGVATAQMGKHYGLPTHTYAALSDSKLVDAQAGTETALSGLLAALARINLIAGVGALDFVGTQSCEKLVLDAEVCGMIGRVLRGIEVSPQTLATDLIVELGPGGDYLSQAHTRRWFKAESYLPGPVIDRLDRKGWEQGGSSDAWSRARTQVQRILAQHQPVPLDPERACRLEEAMRRVMARHGCSSLPFAPSL